MHCAHMYDVHMYGVHMYGVQLPPTFAYMWNIPTSGSVDAEGRVGSADDATTEG